MVVDMVINGTPMSASSACVLCYWACRAGVVGPAQKLAAQPDCSSGNFNKKFNRVVGLDRDDKLMSLEVPSYSKHSLGRSTLHLPVVPFHESFAREVAECATSVHALEQVLAETEMAPAYWSHPVVSANFEEAVEPI